MSFALVNILVMITITLIVGLLPVGRFYRRGWLDEHEDPSTSLNGRSAATGAIRGGKLNDPWFGSRIFTDQISQMFHVARRKARLPGNGHEVVRPVVPSTFRMAIGVGSLKY
jgi:hypothetical protein